MGGYHYATGYNPKDGEKPSDRYIGALQNKYNESGERITQDGKGGAGNGVLNQSGAEEVERREEWIAKYWPGALPGMK